MGKKNKLFRERMKQSSKKDIEEIVIEDHYKTKKEQQAKEREEREQKEKIEKLKMKEVKVEENVKETVRTKTEIESEAKPERSGYAKNVIARREAQEAEQKRKDEYQKVVYEKLKKMDEDRLR